MHPDAPKRIGCTNLPLQLIKFSLIYPTFERFHVKVDVESLCLPPLMHRFDLVGPLLLRRVARHPCGETAHNHNARGRDAQRNIRRRNTRVLVTSLAQPRPPRLLLCCVAHHPRGETAHNHDARGRDRAQRNLGRRHRVFCFGARRAVLNARRGRR